MSANIISNQMAIATVAPVRGNGIGNLAIEGTDSQATHRIY